MRFLLIISITGLPILIFAQNRYGNHWVLGAFSNGSLINFDGDSFNMQPIVKEMSLEPSCTVMSDSSGNLLFYSNGCYIANANHQMMMNGDSIGKGYLESSFCETGGSPITQGIIALPKPESNHLYYLFYTDLEAPYEYPIGLYFPLAPLTLYYSLIDINLDGGLGSVVEKNQIIIQDTLARGMIQAQRHANGKDWWIIMPKSHSNCYYTILLTNNGIDTVFLQCIGENWGDEDPTGQAVFSPNGQNYVRFNDYYGLNIFNFDNTSGDLSNFRNIVFDQDTFVYSGVSFSPNSRFLYACAYTKLWQIDMLAADINSSKILIAELMTPPNITQKTRFVYARLAPDGKIYIASAFAHKHLHVIHNPNCYGTSCNLEQYAIELTATNTHTMPNLPHYKSWNETDTCSVSGVGIPTEVNTQNVVVYPNPFISVFSMQGLMPGDKIRVFNLTGYVVYESEVYSSESHEIDLYNLPDGVYSYSVQNGTMLNTGKIIKILRK
ncbi:MAG: T9SS C-terminal target domain-containing protein [Haliscomenobacteraceae bacterium CHB4]|nr:T9SS C-terminal target domain-containing protein [Haliscomenobacteraceae bacterium CHB4]